MVAPIGMAMAEVIQMHERLERPRTVPSAVNEEEIRTFHHVLHIILGLLSR
jgi:hypothetical protein